MDGPSFKDAKANFQVIDLPKRETWSTIECNGQVNLRPK